MRFWFGSARRRMSLATKSRWMFGIAAFAVIAAAALVTYQRAEQLTSQLNLSAGRAMAQTEIARHIAQMIRAPAATSQPSREPLKLQFDGLARPLVEPQLVPMSDLKQALPRSFRADAIDRFTRRRDRENYYRVETVDEGDLVYLYAEPLRNVGSCVQCHAPAGTALFTPPAIRVPGFRWPDPVVVATTRPSGGVEAPVGELLGAVIVQIPDQVDPKQLILNRVALIGGALIGGLLAIVTLSFIITRLILRPVRVLQETAEKVSAGDLNVRADIATGDEFQKLADTVNRMLRNMKVSRDQLSAANRTLDLQIVKLSETNVGLAESNRLKNEFLANVSHELRTPLNSILGFTDLLRETLPKDDARTTRYLTNIRSSGTNLLELINDLLDLAKIEAGRVDVKPGELSLSDLFERLGGLLKPLLERKSLTLNVSVSPDVPIVRTDAARLQQVLYNLLSNAIKFSPTGQPIDLVAGREDESHVRIAVIDRGPGIDPANHQMIFEKFRQLDQSATRQFGGTGLGLSISRELMTLLGGTIGVDSELGKGATFWLTLPIGDHVLSDDSE